MALEHGANRPGADLDALEAVPASLHDLLMARLDGLGDAKRVAQVAAVHRSRVFGSRCCRPCWTRAPLRSTLPHSANVSLRSSTRAWCARTAGTFTRSSTAYP